MNSDPSPEAGWWQASDGKWYPPDAAAPPKQPPPPASAPQPPKPPPVAPPDIRFCRSCGAQLNPGAGFCGACGMSQSVVPSPVNQTDDGRELGIAGLVCALVSILFFPIILGPLALVLGAVSWSKGNQFGMISTLLAVPCMLAGFFLGALVWTSI